MRPWTIIAALAALAVAGAGAMPQPTADPPAAAPRAFLAALSVGDLDRSIAFYQRHFGFAVTQRSAFPEHRMEIAFLEQSGFQLELVALAGSAPRQAPEADNDASLRGIAKLGFLVDDIDATAARLRTAGVEIMVRPSTLAGTVSGGLARDPDGNLIGIYQAAR
jgi:catechol 2,3-dioxygenase-like lactoylglutathione lyase family enzyme